MFMTYISYAFLYASYMHYTYYAMHTRNNNIQTNTNIAAQVLVDRHRRDRAGFARDIYIGVTRLGEYLLDLTRSYESPDLVVQSSYELIASTLMPCLSCLVHWLQWCLFWFQFTDIGFVGIYFVIGPRAVSCILGTAHDFQSHECTYQFFARRYINDCTIWKSWRGIFIYRRRNNQQKRAKGETRWGLKSRVWECLNIKFQEYKRVFRARILYVYVWAVRRRLST